ncbi:MAG TPA: MFS transporter [Opitutus sp.]|nr:MFS transporter [Opitutus sp.]
MSTIVSSSAHSATAGFGRHLPLILALALATGTEAFTTSAVGIALPRIAGDFAASPDEISWAVTLYLAAFTVFLPLTAWRADILGQRRFLGASIVVYLVASLGCMLSPSLPVFLAWRVVQGAAGATFLARAVFTFTKEFRPPVLFNVFFIFMAAFSLRALGLPLGGYLVDHLSWRWLFAVPAVVLAGGALPALLASEEVWPAQRERRPDFSGLALLTAGLGALTILAVRGERDDWFASPAILALLGFAIVALPVFAWEQHRAGNRHPLITFASLRRSGMGVGMTLSFLAGLMLVGGVYVLPQFLERVTGTDAYRAGWLMSIDAFAMIAGLASAVMTIRRVRTRGLLAVSGLAFAGSMLLLAFRITSATPVEALWLPLALHGFGVGLALPPIGIFSFGAIGADHRLNGEGRAWHYTARQLGATVAVATAVGLIDTRATVHSSALAANFTVENPLVRGTAAAIAHGLAAHGVTPALSLPAARAVLDHLLVRESTVLAFHDLFLATALVGIAVALLGFALPKPGAARQPVPVRPR